MKIINILTPCRFKIIWDDTASKMHLTQVTSVTCTSDWQQNLTHSTCMICDIFNTKVNTSLTLCSTHIYWRKGKKDGWMDERCFRPLLCTVKAELGLGQPELMRRNWMKHCPTAVSIARPSTLQPTALPSELAAAPKRQKGLTWLLFLYTSTQFKRLWQEWMTSTCLEFKLCPLLLITNPGLSRLCYLSLHSNIWEDISSVK